MRNQKTKLEPEYVFLQSLLKAREKRGLTQVMLAKKMRIKQPVISRLERGGLVNAKVKTLKRLAKALNMRLIIELKT